MKDISSHPLLPLTFIFPTEKLWFHTKKQPPGSSAELSQIAYFTCKSGLQAFKSESSSKGITGRPQHLPLHDSTISPSIAIRSLLPDASQPQSMALKSTVFSPIWTENFCGALTCKPLAGRSLQTLFSLLHIQNEKRKQLFQTETPRSVHFLPFLWHILHALKRQISHDGIPVCVEMGLLC